jgi:hypothetical protein
VARRVDEHFGHLVGWIRCLDLAQYTAAAAAVQITREQQPSGERLLRVQAPFAAQRFTISVPLDGAVTAVSLDAGPLARAEQREALAEETFLTENNRLYISWNLKGSQQLIISPK